MRVGRRNHLDAPSRRGQQRSQWLRVEPSSCTTRFPTTCNALFSRLAVPRRCSQSLSSSPSRSLLLCYVDHLIDRMMRIAGCTATTARESRRHLTSLACLKAKGRAARSCEIVANRFVTVLRSLHNFSVTNRARLDLRLHCRLFF